MFWESQHDPTLELCLLAGIGFLLNPPELAGHHVLSEYAYTGCRQSISHVVVGASPLRKQGKAEISSSRLEEVADK